LDRIRRRRLGGPDAGGSVALFSGAACFFQSAEAAAMAGERLMFGLASERLHDRCWRFGIDNGFTHAPFLRLTSGGRVMGYRNPNEASWKLQGGLLALVDAFGQTSTLFDQCFLGQDGLLVLKGYFRDSITLHVLQEIVGGGALVSPDPEMRLIQRKAAGSRQNLVILRANERSMHVQWRRDLPDEARSWDLCTSFYGNPDNFPVDDYAEYSILQDKERKFQAIKKLMHQNSALWGYDYIMLPDDDLDMSWSDINTLFAVCREYELQLAQPSLHPLGVINYNTTRQNSAYTLRFVSMVEIMTPIFSRQALLDCIHTFDFNLSGFGIDYAWSKLVEGPATKIAIIDSVSALHTRPTGVSYNFLAAVEEGYAVSKRFGNHDAAKLRQSEAIAL
jgi:hypothetical protein